MPPETDSPTSAAPFLREHLLKLYNLPADASDAAIAAAVTAEKAELETERARRTQEAADELVIDAKMKVGLTREQAIAVIKRQKDHDAAIEKLWADRRPRIVDILKEGLSDRETRAAIRELDGSITLGEINAAKATMAAQ